jgi:hypothetical protein
VVIPNVDHRNLGSGHTKEALREPHGVAIEIELLQLVLELQREASLVLLKRVLALRPLFEERCLTHYSVVVDLITSAKHDMEWPSLVVVQNIAPHRVRSTELFRVDAQRETVAAVEHHIHRLALARDPEADRWTAVDPVGNTSLVSAEFNFEVESPESDASFSV